MKKLFVLTSTLIMIACSNKPSATGEVEVENGEGKKVSIKYSIPEKNYSKFSSVITKDDLKKIVEKCSSEAKMSCKHTPTYEPKEIDLIVKGESDTILTYLTFYAQNSFGVKGSEIKMSTFKGSKFISNTN